MLIRSIYGETPEGAVPVEDRGPTEKYEKYFVDQSSWVGPNKEKCEKHFTKQSKLWWSPTDRLSKKSQRTKQVGVAETAP